MATKSKRHRKTPEQRKAEAQALHDTLTAEVEQLAGSQEWRRYLDFLGSFHTYSFTNVMLILAQKPDASLVAGFRQWQAKGRQVRKGEKSIKIRGYSTKKVTETDEETGDEVEKIMRRYPILSVFDISQTDATDEPGTTPETTTIAQRLTGEDPAGIHDAMADHLRGQGWTVTREPIPGEVNGYTTADGSRRIVVDEALAPAMAAKTMLHEAAHAILHVTGDDATDYIAHRGRCECEAESVAYVLAGLAGLDTSAYSVGYITTWIDGDVKRVRAAAENVLHAVHTLSPAILEDEEQDADPDGTIAADNAA